MRFLVLGAGRMGSAVVYDLRRNKRVKQVIAVDLEQRKLDEIKRKWSDERVTTVKADVSDIEQISYLFSGCDVVISCVNHKYNYELAKAALESKVHFCDLGGNEDVVRREFLLDEMARDKGVAIIPDCGLAPGLVSILTANACSKLEKFSEIRIRVGGLPLEPRPPLNYSLFSSVEGLINDYVEDATVIRGGKLMRVPSLHDLEEIEFPEPFGKLEAFNTSGGISTLPTSLGDVKHLDYKTIRYQGHCNMVRMLKDLGLMETRPLKIGQQNIRPRAILATLLEQKLPKDEPDVVIIRTTVSGTFNGEPQEIAWQCIDYMDEENGISAMRRTTAFPISIVAQMVACGEITARGTLTQERHVPSELFINQMKERGIPLEETVRSLVPPSS